MSSVEHPISQRIKIILNRESNGKVVDFSSNMSGIPYQIVSRLFKPDNRSGKYPTPSTDLILQIINKFTLYNPIWLLTGEGEMLRGSNYEKKEGEYLVAQDKSVGYNDDYWRGRYDQLKEEHDRLLQELNHIKSASAS